jgi:hypothetical protein
VEGWVNEQDEMDMGEIIALESAIQLVCFLLTKVSISRCSGLGILWAWAWGSVRFLSSQGNCRLLEFTSVASGYGIKNSIQVVFLISNM